MVHQMTTQRLTWTKVTTSLCLYPVHLICSFCSVCDYPSAIRSSMFFGFTVTHCSIVLRLIVFSLCRYTSAGIVQLFSDFGVDVGIMSAVCKIAFVMLSLDIVLCTEPRLLRRETVTKPFKCKRREQVRRGDEVQPMFFRKCALHLSNTADVVARGCASWRVYKHCGRVFGVKWFC